MKQPHIELPQATYRIAAKAIYRQIFFGNYRDQQNRIAGKRYRTMTENKNELREMSISFALEIAEICEAIKGCHAYTEQLIRCSSSVGANLFEARYAQSRADFIHKLEISLKECSETEFWIELLHRRGKISDDRYNNLNNTRGIIQRKLIASITTAKKNGDN